MVDGAEAATPEGVRNDMLHNVAFQMGQLVGIGLLNLHHVEQGLRRVARQAGLPDGEARATIASGLNAGLQNPRAPAGTAHLFAAASPFAALTDQSGGAGGLHLTLLQDLLAEPQQAITWLVDGLLPNGGLSLLAAKPKVGKSTLARNLALAVASGAPFLDRAVTPGPVVYLALEEHRAGVADHFTRLGATNQPIHIHVGSAPEEALAALAAAVLEHAPVLAIVDPLLRLVRLHDANDYAQVNRAFEPLLALARRSGCHICCVHHMGKGERSGADAILGSTALHAAVDTALLMHKRDGGRVLSSDQRYGVNLDKTVLAFDEATGALRAAGTLAAAETSEAMPAILDVLKEGALTEKEIGERVSANRTTLGHALRALCEVGDVQRSGSGRRGDPYTYALPPAPDAPLLYSPNNGIE